MITFKTRKFSRRNEINNSMTASCETKGSKDRHICSLVVYCKLKAKGWCECPFPPTNDVPFEEMSDVVEGKVKVLFI